jgi:ADP-heptose:LPS heptosyltransferase
MLSTDYKILFTLTPDAEKWYMTDELKLYIAVQTNVTFISKKFSFEEISGYIAGASKFSTVNTGLLWLALSVGQKVVVCDTDEPYEWNPSPYGATRLHEPSPEDVAQALRV